MHKYLLFCFLFVACTPEKQPLQVNQQTKPCEFPSWETMQASLPDQLFCYDSNKTNIQVTALLIASAEGNLTVVQSEIDRGSNVNFQDKLKGYTAISYATIREHIIAVKLLLESGADPNIPRSDNGLTEASNGATPLVLAANSNIEIVKLLLEHGADPNKPRSSNGLTTSSDGSAPLLLAADADEMEIVRLLLEYGADPNQKNADNGLTNFSQGGTALVMAIIVNNAEMVRLLLEHGADPNIEIKLLQDKGITLLDYARIYASRKIVNMLEKQGLTKSTIKGSLLCMPRTPFWSKCW